MLEHSHSTGTLGNKAMAEATRDVYRKGLPAEVRGLCWCEAVGKAAVPRDRYARHLARLQPLLLRRRQRPSGRERSDVEERVDVLKGGAADGSHACGGRALQSPAK